MSAIFIKNIIGDYKDMKDVIELNHGCLEPKIKCLDHGFVSLLDCMPRLIPDGESTADFAIPKAARLSYMRARKTMNEDIALTRYLKRRNHTSPFEKVKFQFMMKLPIYVARQWIRHRVVNLNEMSGRYTEMPEEFHIPETLRIQSFTNLQGSEGEIEGGSQKLTNLMRDRGKEAFDFYHELLEAGVSKEQARTVLPLSTYTQWDWTIDLHNLLHLLDLRCDSHAQDEIQVYANAVLDLIRPIIPHTIKAWEDYSPYRDGVLLTRFEVEALKKAFSASVNSELCIPQIEPDNKFERNEWKEKLVKMGLIDFLKIND